MIEIADRAQVSRASLYNHFRDKHEVFLALVESELERISTLAMIAQSRSEALYLISSEISNHPGLKSALISDGEIMANALTARAQLAKIFATDVVGVGLILRWLMGQVTAPLSDAHSKEQAERLASIL